MGRMSNHGLAGFLEQLASEGQLVRVATEVDGDLEIAEITCRVADAGGPALLFERVRGQTLSVVTNVLGTPGRACRALGIDSLDEIATRLEAAAREHTPQSWFDRLKLGGEQGIEKFRPRLVKAGACQQVVHLGRDVNLATFPLVRSWPHESGPSLLGGLLFADSAEVPPAQACPVTLMQLDVNRLAIIDASGEVVSRLWQRCRDAQTQVPVAMVLGGDPVLTVAAHIDLPAAAPAPLVAGLFRGQALDFVKCRTHSLEVPAAAELIVEGFLDPQSDEAAVTIGAGRGTYRPAAAVAVLHVSAITHRTRAIIPALVAGQRSGEAAVLAKLWERTLLPTVQRLAADVTDISLPLLEGVQRFAFVALKKRFPHQARQVAAALWGTPALRRTRFLMFVDAEVDVHDPAAVWGRVGANVDPAQDLFSWDGPADPADFAESHSLLSRRVAFDATTKVAGERTSANAPPLAAGEEIVRLVTSRWAEYRIPLSAAEPARITGL
jgi:4-hydroxy-3-polyprenylbenzoate decarboxylase